MAKKASHIPRNAENEQTFQDKLLRKNPIQDSRDFPRE
jgi:hypothetical protein